MCVQHYPQYSHYLQYNFNIHPTQFEMSNKMGENFCCCCSIHMSNFLVSFASYHRQSQIKKQSFGNVETSRPLGNLIGLTTENSTRAFSFYHCDFQLHVVADAVAVCNCLCCFMWSVMVSIFVIYNRIYEHSSISMRNHFILIILNCLNRLCSLVLEKFRKLHTHTHTK